MKSARNGVGHSIDSGRFDPRRLAILKKRYDAKRAQSRGEEARPHRLHSRQPSQLVLPKAIRRADLYSRGLSSEKSRPRLPYKSPRVASNIGLPQVVRQMPSVNRNRLARKLESLEQYRQKAAGLKHVPSVLLARNQRLQHSPSTPGL